MAIPRDLTNANLPRVNKQDEEDYEELMRNVLHALRQNDFPFELDLRTMRQQAGFSAVKSDYCRYAINRALADVDDAGYLTQIITQEYGNYEMGMTSYKIMRVCRPPT